MAVMPSFAPINFKKWIDENRASLKPPVGNKLIWEDREFIVMVVGGPNSRTDYHINAGEEFFYQIEGDIVVKVIQDGQPVDVAIRQDEMFLLPPSVPHSPRRPANTLGLVIERKRLPGELDGFQWHCEKCGHKLYEEKFELTDIVRQFPPIFERFYNSDKTKCAACGANMEKP
jgi:3-hydroxyanthranilate 3,4-dioxygenase